MTPTRLVLLPAFAHIKFDRIRITFEAMSGPFRNKATGAPFPLEAEIVAPPGEGRAWAHATFPGMELEVLEVTRA